MNWRFIALPTQLSSEYVWFWRRENEKGKPDQQSARTFAFYYECLEDARRHGYSGLPPQLHTLSDTTRSRKNRKAAKNPAIRSGTHGRKGNS